MGDWHSSRCKNGQLIKAIEQIFGPIILYIWSVLHWWKGYTSSNTGIICFPKYGSVFFRMSHFEISFIRWNFIEGGCFIHVLLGITNADWTLHVRNECFCWLKQSTKDLQMEISQHRSLISTTFIYWMEVAQNHPKYRSVSQYIHSKKKKRKPNTAKQKKCSFSPCD